MKLRQVHLDFHTSELIPGVGSEFSKENFQSALKLGHVDSITVFAKCHHGWSYHPTKVGATHPTLKRDLLGEQIAAAHEIGVRVPVYLSAGWDERMAWAHPEWLFRPSDDAVHFDKPGYHLMCMNTAYLDYLLAQIDEVVKNYDCDEIFLDIVGVRPCRCRRCVEGMLKEGLDPYSEDDTWAYGEKIYAEYARRVRETIDRVKPGLPVFHNSGHVSRGRRDLAHFNSHLELESLPTGGWGYDHLPLSASYAGTIGMEYLGMTGKFHTTWGEFGGFKHPNALIYETSLNAAFGAGSSVGDQLHPCGKADEATYALIGEAYEKLEGKEKWLTDTESLADIALLSAEAVSSYYGKPFGRDDELQSIYDGTVDAGAVRVLSEGKYLFDVIDTEADLSKYRLLILPDNIRLDEKLTEWIVSFTENGGKVLATGTSGLKADADEFALDLGAEFIGKSKYSPVYLIPEFDTGYRKTAFVVYSPAFDIASDGKVVIGRENPYFNRTALTFSSHMHAPNDASDVLPAAVVSGVGAYVSAALFTEYAKVGSLISKRMLTGIIDMLLPDKTVETTLPAQGVVTLRRQADRLVLHALYASPVKRGEGVEIIEDIVPLYGVSFKVRIPEPKRLYSAPDGREIPFTYENGAVVFTADKIDCHFMAVAEY